MHFRKWIFAPCSLAILALGVGQALAQSSVNLYGRVDLGVKYAPIDLATSTIRQAAVDDSSRGRWGLRGEEDLGDGNKVFFQLEQRFSADTGVQDGVLFKDKAWVGVTNRDAGTLRFGRMSSPQDWLGVSGRFEAFGGDSYASNGTRGAKSAAKWDNTIYYETQQLAGFTAGVAYAAGEKVRKSSQGFHLDYADGPLVAAVTYQQEQDPTAGSAITDGAKTTTLAARYQLPFMTPMFTYARTNNLGANDKGRETVWTVGARVPAGPGEVRVSFRRIDDDHVNGATFVADKDSDRLGVGYYYPLSKRTSLNFSLVRERIKTFNANGSTKTSYAGTGGEVAIRHNF